MRFASYIISLCLHAGLFLLIWFWPAPPPLRIDAPPIMISLVEGETGGDRAPSPILGHIGAPSDGPQAPAPPAPQSEVAVTPREEIRAPEPKQGEMPIKKPAIPEPKQEPKEPPKVEEVKPEIKEVKKPEPPKPEPKKPELPKQEPKKQEPKKPEPKKPAPKPAPKKPAVDPIAAALQKARQATSRANSGDKGNAIEQALAQARRNAGGTGGGGGGEGSGPGGGGLGDVYIGQIMNAVRPNWGFSFSGRQVFVCIVKVNVDLQGIVQTAVITKSSGNRTYDASAVNAIMRTSAAGDFPPPPNQGYTDLDLVFTYNNGATQISTN